MVENKKTDKKVARKKVDKKVDDSSAQKVRIKIKSFDHKIIDKSTGIIIEAIDRSGANFFGPIPLPVEKKRYTVNRSTFVNKTARDQYEMRIHKRIIDIVDPSSKIIENLSNLSLPAGVDIEIKMK